MEDDIDAIEQQPLDFSRHSNLCRCPYCGEDLNEEEMDTFFSSEGNAFRCPSCRKKLNIDEVG